MSLIEVTLSGPRWAGPVMEEPQPGLAAAAPRVTLVSGINDGPSAMFGRYREIEINQKTSVTMPARTRWRMRIALLFLAVAAAAPAGEVPLKLARLDLVDGRTLTNVVIKSYDAASGRLLLVADGTAMLVPVSLVPAPFAARFKAVAPPAGATMSVVATQPPAAGTNVANPAPVAQASDSADSERQLARHREVAEDRARRYFESEYRAGSNAISVTKLDIQTKPPEAVDGWPGRYRTKGRAYLEFFESKGRSFSRGASSFEVITEQKPDQSVAVVDFTAK